MKENYQGIAENVDVSEMAQSSCALHSFPSSMERQCVGREIS